jgi:hypothetical protein
MAEQTIKQDIARLVLLATDGTAADAEDVSRIRGAIEAANKLGCSVCCDIKFQQVAGKEDIVSSPLALDFFVFVPDRRKS